MNIDAIVEIPMNSNIKYEYDKDLNMIRYNRTLKLPMVYPCNYGFIPNTLGGDGDPLDILILSENIFYPGIIINCKIIGVLLMEDEEGIDEKLIGIPNIDINNNQNMNDLNDISEILLKKIKYFFTNYKNYDKDKWSKVYNYENKEKAIQIIHKYKNKL
tara:strand:+ start:3074 stop:3550 length:477 start_codon:yes stop_codon:yes gene_type:complete